MQYRVIDSEKYIDVVMIHDDEYSNEEFRSIVNEARKTKDDYCESCKGDSCEICDEIDHVCDVLEWKYGFRNIECDRYCFIR